MTEQYQNPIAIDRLTGEPYSDQPLTSRWTVQDAFYIAQQNAREPFELDTGAAKRLEADLNAGAIILASADEVNRAIKQGITPIIWEKQLEDAIIEDGIAVISINSWSRRRERTSLERQLANYPGPAGH